MALTHQMRNHRDIADMAITSNDDTKVQTWAVSLVFFHLPHSISRCHIQYGHKDTMTMWWHNVACYVGKLAVQNPISIQLISGELRKIALTERRAKLKLISATCKNTLWVNRSTILQRLEIRNLISTHSSLW